MSVRYDAPQVNHTCSAQQSSMTPQAELSYLTQLENLLDDFGPDGVAGATCACAITAFGEKLIDSIMANDSLPQATKDAAVALIRGHIDQARAAANPQALAAVSNSEVGSQAAAGGHEAAHEAHAHASEGTPAGGGAPAGGGTSAGGGASASGSAPAGGSAGSAQGAGGGGAGGGMTMDDALMQAAVDQQQQSNDSEETSRGGSTKGGKGKGGGGNWLMLIAKNLSKACDTFAKEMIAASQEMADSAGGATPNAGSGGGGAGSTKFLEANARLSASSQMFSTCMNALSTIIKTIGEGVAAVARKQ